MINGMNYWYQRAKDYEQLLEKLADPNHAIWVSENKHKTINGTKVFYIKDIQELAKLAKDVLAKHKRTK